MISLRLTRWLLGYVRFSVVGGSPEKFLNNCAKAGINLWDMKGGADSGGCVAAQRYRELRHCARNAKCKLKLKEKHGLAFATKGIRRRKGILAGAAIFCIVIYILSMHFWSIEINGNTTIKTEEMLAKLSNMGVKPGVLKSDVEPKILQQKLMIEFPKISWLTVNTKGCSAEIKLQEKVDPPEIEEQSSQSICNIKAAQTGQIVSMEVYTGTPLVKKGDAVYQGQLLISSVVEDNLGFSSLRHASGKIIASTSRTLETEVELNRKVTNLTGKVVTRKSLSLFGARIPLTFRGKPQGDYKKEGMHTDLKLMNSVLPLSVYEEKWTEQKTEDIKLTREQAIEEAKKQIQNMQKEQLKDVKITEAKSTDKITDSKLIYTVYMKCEENIAQESEILIK